MNSRRFPWALLIFGLVTGVAGAAEAPIPWGDNPAAGKFYDIRGFRMYCEVYGSGKPLLLIHGHNGSIARFAPTLPYFAAHYRVIVADSRAQGKSRDDGEALTFEMMADDCAALLDALHVEAAHVLGSSDGGIVALLLALRHPEKVISLAASGANLRPDPDALGQGLWDRMHADYERRRDQPRTTAKEKNDWKLFLLDWEQPHIAPAELKAVRCPALVICGDHDAIVFEHTLEIYHSLPQAALYVVPRSGHLTLIQHPDEVARTVDAFFAAPDPRKTP
ncbi:MAG TPA: alpha/beta hydrolase [Opitutaceae bacterium]|nr:alpha/beta hydrolase [Opitutaceae bacterium]